MTARILDGTATLKAIKADLGERVAALRERGVVPGLGTVLVGDDPGSRWYVNTFPRRRVNETPCRNTCGKSSAVVPQSRST